MKRKILLLQFLILFLCFTAQISFSQNNEPFSLDKSPLPNPTSPIMDYANVLDSATQKRLETRVIEFKKATNPTVELAVAIVKTTGDRPIFDYSLAVSRGWGIGSREADNPSALLFIAIDDRKYFTQVSRDLEDELPDGLVGSLQRQYLVPQFKAGNYAKGVEDTIEAYIKTINSKNDNSDNGGLFYPQNDANEVNENSPRISDDFDCGKLFPCLIMLGILIFIILANIGGGGGGGGGRRGRRNSGSNVAGDILGGILTGIILGGSGGGSSSGGSSWGSGGSSSSGGGWGGFGGGGDFGGGGAGGGW